MAYVEGLTVHDADAHVVELPGTLEKYIVPAQREKLSARLAREEFQRFAANAAEKHADPVFRAGADENILLRKNFEALGAFTNTDRPRALDLLGFASQLVFTTAGLSLGKLEQEGDAELVIEGARAHNRMMIEYCAIDRRLLPVAYVPMIDRKQAVTVAREAIAMGCKGLMIPSAVPKGHSPSHVDFDSLWATAQEAQLPILFHVGGEKKMDRAYFENGQGKVSDFLGGSENFTAVAFMAIAHSIEQTLGALVFDGVFDRFPRLKFGAIEMGAGWVPSLLQFMDSSAAAFHKEERVKKLSAKPSELLRRQFFATPYPYEDVGWIIRSGAEDIVLFSSDYPHIEGGRNPMKRFNDTLEGISESARKKFYSENFIRMMGAGLDASLHVHPSLVA